MGLSIARSLAALNLGGLHVASIEGEGSKFSVTLPLANNEAIVNCYVDQRLASGDDCRMVNITEVVPSEYHIDHKTEIGESIDEFLRDSVATFDLILRPQEQRWLALTTGTVGSVKELSKRLTTEWSKLKNDRYGAPLPELRLRHITTIDASSYRDQLIKIANSDPEFKLPNFQTAHFPNLTSGPLNNDFNATLF